MSPGTLPWLCNCIVIALVGYASDVTSMSTVARLSPDWKEKKNCCKVIIETPKGGRNKFKYDEASGLFKLGGLLPEGLSFPFDFGFAPGTLGGDGDPLDVLVLMEEPAHVGCLLEARIVGVIEAEQIENKRRAVNDRLIGVAIHSYSHEDVANIDQVNASLLDQIEEFFISYNKSRGRSFRPTGRHGPKRAAKVIEEGIAAFDRGKQAGQID